MGPADVLRTVYARVQTLPPLPAAVPRILALAADPEVGTREITGVLSRDPALAADVLKVANSAYYGFRREIDSLDRAVALLGVNMVRSLAVSVGVARVLPPARTKGFRQEGLWVHSAAVATAARGLCRRTGRADGEQLFLAGLLHDVGKMVLAHHFPGPFGRALAAARADGTPLPDAERAEVGLDHAAVGGMLLDRWNFPEVLRAPVTGHHADRPADGGAALVAAADALARQAGIGDGGNPAPPEDVAGDLPADVFEAERAALEAARDEIEAFAGAMG